MQLFRIGPGSSYETRLLAPPDLATLQYLFELAADYFEIATGAPAAPDEAARAFVGGPATKTVDDKRVIGIFTEDGVLVGVLDAIVDFPHPGTWTMGMLLLAPDHRGAGLGSTVLDAYEAWARRSGARAFRTAVVTHHERGLRFLERAGYQRVSTLNGYHSGAREAAVAFLEKRTGVQQ